VTPPGKVAEEFCSAAEMEANLPEGAEFGEVDKGQFLQKAEEYGFILRKRPRIDKGPSTTAVPISADVSCG
jgi:hypothetical protein